MYSPGYQPTTDANGVVTVPYPFSPAEIPSDDWTSSAILSVAEPRPARASLALSQPVSMDSMGRDLFAVRTAVRGMCMGSWKMPEAYEDPISETYFAHTDQLTANGFMSYTRSIMKVSPGDGAAIEGGKLY